MSGEYGKVKDRSAPPCFTLFTNKKSFKYNSGFHFRVMCFIFLLLFFVSLFASYLVAGTFSSLLIRAPFSLRLSIFTPLISLVTHSFVLAVALRAEYTIFSNVLNTQQHFSDYNVLHATHIILSKSDYNMSDVIVKN